MKKIILTHTLKSSHNKFLLIVVHWLQMSLLVPEISLVRSSLLKLNFFRDRLTHLSSEISAAF